jgi:chemotaxis protein CheX
MNVEYINPFVTSTISVFSSMLSCRLERQELRWKSVSQPEHEISGVIGLSGRATGMVVLSLSRHVALNAAEAMLGERHDSVDADVADAIGELTNIIAGSAKARLESLEMSISLPTVITGKNHVVNFPSDATPICIPFDSPWGPLCLDVSLVEVSADQRNRPPRACAAASG